MNDATEAIERHESSGNVFADLGLPDADVLLAKADLAIEIAAIIQARAWTQERAAQEMGLDQPKVSALVRGRLRDFSLERLMLLLTRLGQDVDITPYPASPHAPSGRLRVYDDDHTIAATRPVAPTGVRFD
jgi:predicted XRE-type DNA-binding protein